MLQLHETKKGVPTAHITSKKSRIKSYGDKIYLKDGTNFEIELFNPLEKRVLVKIEIDGMLISSTGIIVNPGQRSYLERWIDDRKKFVFNTYEIDNTEESQKAIKNNGNIKISFYEEQDKNFIQYYQNYPNWNGIITYPQNFPWSTEFPPFYTTCNNDSSMQSGVSSKTTISNNNYNFSTEALNEIKYEQYSSNSLETGRTDKGEKSDQSFSTSSGDFNFYTTIVWEWNLLPISQKPLEISMIRDYCTNCRNRIRAKTWQFCPKCGGKL